ncbi:MAG: 2-hydroxyacyl-CoA dehydratase family protein [Myxococcota bacterium]|jgi:benzoyl-CoA reductase/2-hydroxyglutaryl-CoA dehydratase subunit BcrC/BadD/HgdB
MENKSYTAAREAACKGVPAVAILPGYFPPELIAAAGAHPFRVWGGRPDTVHADGALQSYICSMAKSVLEDILDGTLDFASGYVVPAVCDTMQNMSDLIAAQGKKVFCMRLPRASYRPEAEEWLAHEVARFGRWIEEITGNVPSNAALSATAARYDNARAALLELYSKRRKSAAPFPAAGFYSLILDSFMCSPEDTLKRIPGYLTSVPAGKTAGHRVVVTGTAPIPTGFLDVLEESGLTVVEDDFMAGRRVLSRPALSSFEKSALFEAFLGGAPCSSNTFNHDARPGYLIDLAAASKAAGVVFWETKACENEAFDLPWLVEGLQKAGLKTMVIETEQKMRTFETAATRVAAFAETL